MPASAEIAAAAAVQSALDSFLTAHVPTGPFLVGCSGGADSLALAVGALAVAGPRRCRAVTVDHGLQPGSADLSAGVVDRLRLLGFRDAEVVTVRVGRDGGPEAAARDARRRALREAAGPDPVLLGHTLDDQAETVLLGLARGSGPRSIAGMRAWRPPWGRPLLGLRRTETEAACRAAGVAFWTDPHNADPAFMRVRVRREVLPLLEDVLHEGVAAALARTAGLMADDLDALDDLAVGVLGAARRPGDPEALIRDELSGQPRALRRRALRVWVAQLGGGPLTADHLTRLDQLAVLGLPGASVRLPGGPGVPGGIDVVVGRDDLRHRPVDRPAPTGERLQATQQRTARPRPQDPGSDVSGDTRSLTTTLSSADAIRPGQGEDIGRSHGYPGELAATLITRQSLEEKVHQLAAAVAADHTHDQPPLLVCVLKGAVMFVTDFARALPIPSELEFMAVSSYGSATSSSGVVRILKDLDRDITGRRVVIVEDIIDSGLTLSWLRKNLASRGPAAIDVVALMRKPDAVKVELEVRYVGFDIPTDFVVGYGLDFNERYRDLPFVGLLGEHMYR